ncbi:protein SMG9 [Anoplophora glabripennis]|uniref:protein SMG9 n=1 Tax=Anoplophora glabripennis TaxID=217634 RepID=UPI0008740064|nr:protein SMG9 [Anoplophora glabripennis]
MSDYDRNKFYPKKQIFSTRHTTTFTRGFSTVKSEGSYSKFGKDSSSKDTSNETPKKQPTILIKTREPTAEDVVASPKRIQKEEPASNITIVPSVKENEVLTPTLKQMTKSAKLIDEGIFSTESLQEYVQENNDFLVVGVIGSHGVGKSTLLNLLSHNEVTEEIKRTVFKSAKKDVEDDFGDNVKILTEHFEKVDIKNGELEWTEIFKIQTLEDTESSCNATQGIDFFITSNRVMFLDCQPFMSVSVLDDLIQSESKRTNLVSEFIPLENSGEIQSLQLTAFLMSVCHVLVVVQDWFFDSNIVRFIHTAEMLKPTISNPEDELIEHFPHLLLVHNRAQMEDFTPAKFKIMQQTYKMLFHKTKLQMRSNMGLGSGRIINYLNKENCGSPINLYLIPEIDLDSKIMYSGHPPIEDLIRRLRAIILGATKNPLTHIQLTEKTWLVYCSKVWDTVKKSSFFVEYTKLMP